MVKPRQRRGRLRIQRGVVINKPTDDVRQKVHGSHPGGKQRSVSAYLKLTQFVLFVQVCPEIYFYLVNYHVVS
ncbi:hypothetical protein DW184_00885 [Enterobacter cloacae]|nr:hypothetical protein DW184_00885 [Enterobacter cloacae]